jgi:hypothetical protein
LNVSHWSSIFLGSKEFRLREWLIFGYGKACYLAGRAKAVFFARSSGNPGIK